MSHLLSIVVVVVVHDLDSILKLGLLLLGLSKQLYHVIVTLALCKPQSIDTILQCSQPSTISHLQSLFTWNPYTYLGSLRDICSVFEEHCCGTHIADNR
jgi:hypothetical protein